MKRAEAQRTLGRYNILETISTRGMLGDLFRARDTETGRTIALRVVREEIAADAGRRSELLADASAAMAFSHPHIAALFDAGEEEGRLYLAHEFVPGLPLRILLASRPLEHQAVIHLGIQLADALAEAHRHGVVLRNVAPDSVIVTPRDQAKLIDAGLARWTASMEVRARVASALAVRQPWCEAGPEGARNKPASYLSPEQALGEDGDARTDIFALGILLYQMLTGRVPFAGASDVATALKIVCATPPAAASLNPAIPQALDSLVSRMLLKSLDARCGDASRIAAELRGMVEPGSIQQLAPLPELPRSRERSWVLPVVFLGLAAAGLVGWWVSRW